ncbi:hypothetical protein [uncultured Kordia sp.]|uniref:hypothetical protein n=1 Tax=uncultured Kordia sp. TaxID=507699 RepID=UPI002639AD29|nr:hypothetical protein [uncultured Kordia sp.]
MNITTQTVLRHFLSCYEQQLTEKKHPQMSSFFENFFSREELLKILDFMFGDIGLQQVEDLDTASHKELLEVIDDELYILRHYINQWEQELSTHDHINPRGVYNTLEQLGHQTHYLGQKDIIIWDEYDISNYMSLQQKAGKITRVYGIYDVSVSQENVYEVDSPPKRFFETVEDAFEMMHSGVENGTFQKDEVHILERYKAI